MEEEMIIVNPEDNEYYDRLFRVCLWRGYGYALDTFYVYGNDDAMALLEKVVAYAEKNCNEVLTDVDDLTLSLDDEFSEELDNYLKENPESDTDMFIEEYLGFMYVDATTEGAEDVWYIHTENLRIEEVI